MANHTPRATNQNGDESPYKNRPSLSTESYKGVRDFYPHDMAVQNYIFGIWREVCQSFGYEEYGASVLESAELYRAKSGDEIVNEQTYTFIDRGDREVTLRPEMTPTVARMVAARKRELVFPLRWFSMPNLFRYEKPQRGRLREHWQLNVDVFGIANTNAEIEVITLAAHMMRRFGLKDNQYEIRLNHRRIINYILNETLALPPAAAHMMGKLIDRKEKMSAEDFAMRAEEIIGNTEKTTKALEILASKNLAELAVHIGETEGAAQGFDELRNLMAALEKSGITNAVFDQTLMRGFDYYTGIVFEVFDKNPDNRRSLFGGGRYDDLVSIFGQDSVPAFGFGMGDVTIHDVLETYGLLPAAAGPADVAICVADTSASSDEGNAVGFCRDLSDTLREGGIRVLIDYSGKRIGEQIKAADKRGVPVVICVGGDEVRTGELKVKRLSDAKEVIANDTNVVEAVRTLLGK